MFGIILFCTDVKEGDELAIGERNTTRGKVLRSVGQIRPNPADFFKSLQVFSLQHSA